MFVKWLQLQIQRLQSTVDNFFRDFSFVSIKILNSGAYFYLHSWLAKGQEQLVQTIKVRSSFIISGFMTA